MATLEFFYDFCSPFSYLASTQIEKVAQRAGGEVRFRPFFLPGVFKITGNRPPYEVGPKGLYLLKDLERWSRRYGVPFRFPSNFPVNSLLAMRAALVVDKQGKLVPYTHAMYRAVFAEDRDVANPEVVKEVAASVGLDGAAIVAAAPGEKESLTRQTQEAVDRGSFGAPSLFVGEELFVGNDRLEFAEEALKAATRRT